MTFRRKPESGKQLTFSSLFEIPKPVQPVSGSLNFSVELRQVLSNALKNCPKSRFEIASRMSELLGIEVTKNSLDSWCAESREAWRFPFEFSAAFEEATETLALTQLLAGKRGAKVLVGEEVLRSELGKLEMAEMDIKRKKMILKKHLEGK